MTPIFTCLRPMNIRFPGNLRNGHRAFFQLYRTKMYRIPCHEDFNPNNYSSVFNKWVVIVQSPHSSKVIELKKKTRNEQII